MISRKHIFTGLRALATLGLFAWLLHKVEWSSIGRQLVDIQPGWLIAALLMPAFALSLLGLRWAWVLRFLGLPTELAPIYRVTLTGQFFNSFLPGSTGGDIYKISAIWAQHPEQRALAATSVILDRFFAIGALAAIACFSFLANWGTWLPILAKYDIRVPQLGHPLILIALALLLVCALLFYFRILRLPTSLVERVAAYINAIRKSRIHTPRAILGLAGVSSLIHLIYFTGAFFLAKALSLNISYLQVLALMPLLLLAVLLPVTINGHGIREAILISFFTVVQISGPNGASVREMAIAFSLLYVSSDFLWCLPGGVIFMLSNRKSSSSAAPVSS